MRLEFSDFVEHDLEAIGDYIAQGSSSRAVTFVIEIRSKIKQVALNPLFYRLRPEIGMGARLETHGRYVILFRVGDNVVRIERVVHGRRDLAALLL